MPGEQIAPGLYRATLKKPETGGAVIAVSDEAGRPVSQAWTPDYPAEFQVMKDGTPTLEGTLRFDRGKVRRQAGRSSAPWTSPPPQPKELALWLLAAALLLWPVDIWLRRREWSEGRGNSLSAFPQAN